jgi:prepilin-type N-terminal cleavage/methylation domain-containing protein
MERQKMKKKGFTLVELLVVIAIIAMLLAILMPALGKVRQLAQRIMCATNLSGIGKAILTYSTDDKYESFPVAGSSDSTWDRGTSGSGYEGENSFDWRNPKAFPEVAGTHTVTLASHLYLLIKYADVSPDQFICPGSDLKKFQLNNYLMTGIAGNPTNITMTDVWDFGGDYLNAEKDLSNSRNKGHQSYSYQSPVKIRGLENNADHRAFSVSNTSNPATPVMADRNPFWQSPVDATSTARRYHWHITDKKVYAPSIPAGNSTYHQKDGQNVLYADQHSKFEKSANCGIESDNIYTVWGTTTTTGVIDPTTEEFKRQCGFGAPTGSPPPMTATSGILTTSLQTATTPATGAYSLSEVDSYLVSDIDKDDGTGL